jgi:hypothetical protein
MSKKNNAPIKVIVAAHTFTVHDIAALRPDRMVILVDGKPPEDQVCLIDFEKREIWLHAERFFLEEAIGVIESRLGSQPRHGRQRHGSAA